MRQDPRRRRARFPRFELDRIFAAKTLAPTEPCHAQRRDSFERLGSARIDSALTERMRDKVLDHGLMNVLEGSWISVAEGVDCSPDRERHRSWRADVSLAGIRHRNDMLLIACYLLEFILQLVRHDIRRDHQPEPELVWR
jgi:hypothetical protein